MEEKTIIEQVKIIQTQLDHIHKDSYYFPIEEGYILGKIEYLAIIAHSSGLRFLNISITTFLLFLFLTPTYCIKALNQHFKLAIQISLFILIISSLISLLDLAYQIKYKRYSKVWFIFEMMDLSLWSLTAFYSLSKQDRYSVGLIIQASNLATFLIKGVYPFRFVTMYKDLSKEKLTFFYFIFSPYYIIRFFLLLKTVKTLFSVYSYPFFFSLFITFPLYCFIPFSIYMIIFSYLTLKDIVKGEERGSSLFFGFLTVLFFGLGIGTVFCIYSIYKENNILNPDGKEWKSWFSTIGIWFSALAYFLSSLYFFILYKVKSGRIGGRRRRNN